MSIFSNRLRWLREKSGKTQKEMADLLEMSQPGYGKIENGQREPNLDTLVKLPKILNESLDFLLGVTDFDRETNKLWGDSQMTLGMISRYHRRIERVENFETERRERYQDELKHLLEDVSMLKQQYTAIVDNLIKKSEEIPCFSDENRNKIIELQKKLTIDNP